MFVRRGRFGKPENVAKVEAAFKDEVGSVVTGFHRGRNHVRQERVPAERQLQRSQDSSLAGLFVSQASSAGPCSGKATWREGPGHHARAAYVDV